MRLGLFDLIGISAVACFLVVVGVDLKGLQSTSREVDIVVTDVEKGLGFRSGVSWFGLYLNDVKVGFARLARQSEYGGYSVQQDGVLDLEVLGSAQRFEIQLQASLDLSLRLRDFDFALSSEMFDVSVAGVIAEREMNLVVTFGDIEDTMTFPFDEQPLLDICVNSLILSRRPRVGEVIEVDTFDPFGLKPRVVAVEYLGQEQIAVLDGVLSAHRLRRSIAGETLNVWVNDLGEVLKEDLPLGLVAVRETEAAATWGFRRLRGDRVEPLALPPALVGLLGQAESGGSAAR